MPRKSKKGVLGKVDTSSYSENREKDVEYDRGGELPVFDNGVAQLTDIYFKEYDKGENKGEPFFMAAGIIVEPKYVTVDGRKIDIEGRRTQIGPIPYCETENSKGETRTLAENEARILNEIKKLSGGELPEEVEDLEEFVEELKEVGPYFKCRTWRGKATPKYPNPKTNHVWNGVIEDYDPDAVENEEDGDEDDAPEPPKSSSKQRTKSSAKSSTKTTKTSKKKESTKSSKKSSKDDEEPDLEELAEQADNGDVNAQRKLQAIAEDAGVDFESPEDWAGVVALIQESEGEEPEYQDDDEGDSDGDEDETPEKGDSYFYKPPRARKSLECEVTAVFTGKRTCNVRADNGKTYKGVPWDDLKDE